MTFRCAHTHTHTQVHVVDMSATRARARKQFRRHLKYKRPHRLCVLLAKMMVLNIHLAAGYAILVTPGLVSVGEFLRPLFNPRPFHPRPGTGIRPYDASFIATMNSV